MAKPQRKDYPAGLKGNRLYQLALERYNNPSGRTNASQSIRQALAIQSTSTVGKTRGRPKPKPENKTNPTPSKVGDTVMFGGQVPFRRDRDGDWRLLPHGPGGSPTGSGWGQAQQTSATPTQSKPRPPAPEPKPKSKPKADSKPEPKANLKPAAKASETYREGGKGLYQGTQEYRDKVGGSGNPLLNRFRRDMGRDAKTGERQYSTPEDKSKYVDKNGKLKIQDKPKPQPTAAKAKPKPPTSKTGGNTPITASKPMEGGTSFNTRNRFETPEQRKKRLAREGRA